MPIYVAIRRHAASNIPIGVAIDSSSCR